MNLDREPLEYGDRVYYRSLDAFFTVMHIDQKGNVATARSAQYGDITFNGLGHIGGQKQVGWNRPFEAWPTKHQTQNTTDKLGAVYLAAKALL